LRLIGPSTTAVTSGYSHKKSGATSSASVYFTGEDPCQAGGGGGVAPDGLLAGYGA